MELSVIIPALNEEKNIEAIIPAIRDEILRSVESYEIIIVDGGSKDKTRDVAAALGAKVIVQKERGYGGALIAGFRAAQGEYILTMDADLSHKPVFFRDMQKKIQDCEVVIASRYVPGGKATMPVFRKLLSVLLNRVFTTGLSLPIKDISSGFRLYNASALHGIKIKSRDFDVLEEIVIRMYIKSCRIGEVPFHYEPRLEGKSHVKLARFALAYLKTFGRMWKLRYSRKITERNKAKNMNLSCSKITSPSGKYEN
jgi:dolichol-phosphate mannosyltransferase